MSMSHYTQHNVAFGPITRCQICASEDLELVLDLGHQPLCDTLLNSHGLNEREDTYPLRQVWCRECTLNQIDYAVDGRLVYHPSYPYRSGITKELEVYQRAFSAEVIESLGVAKNALVVDIGSNDGTLLSGFKQNGMRVIGVEPTDIGDIAAKNGIPTLKSFFDVKAARAITAEHGHAQVVTATNVFAHMASLGDVIEGIEHLLTPDGFFVLENHYLKQVLATGQFDTVYHEHLRTYSLTSLIKLFSYYDFSVIAAREVDRYGGNIRVVVQKGRGRKAEASVETIVAAEQKAGLSQPETYAHFRALAERAKLDLLDICLNAKRRGERLVGNSCPGRASTLLNYVGIGPDLMPYIAEQPTSLKLGQYLPGKHIPVVDNQILIDEQPDYVVLLAWHYAEPIAAQLRARGLKSKLIIPLPTMRIV